VRDELTRWLGDGERAQRVTRRKPARGVSRRAYSRYQPTRPAPVILGQCFRSDKPQFA
jgi:hypothetical protein